MINGKNYVREEENGALRIGNTRVNLDSVVHAFRRGESPESIQQSFPALSLEQVYGAITYCLAYPDEVDDYMRRQEKLWEEFRARCEANPSPVVKRLRALRRAQEAE